MKKEAITHGVLEDLANRNDNWDKLDGVIDQVTELDESRLILKNEIVNGDFSDGTTGWLGNMSREITENGMRVQSSATYPNIYQPLSLPPAIYYFVFNSIDTIVPTTRFLQVGTVADVVALTPAKRGFYTGRFVISEPAERIYINHFNSELVAIDYTITNTSLINLTQAFGAGNEPTKEEMDSITDTIGYFNGTHTITSKEQFNNLLKMLRTNALATTSLGGGL